MIIIDNRVVSQSYIEDNLTFLALYLIDINIICLSIVKYDT